MKKCFRQKLEFSACLTGVEHGKLLLGATIKILKTLNSSKIKAKVPKTIKKTLELDKYFE